MKAIVITNSINEAIDLNPRCADVGFWGKANQDYSTEWHWLVDGDSISGSSGYNSLPHLIYAHPGTPIYYFKDFQSLKHK